MARKTVTATGLLPLPSLIRAASTDAGNNSMRRAKRSKWSRKDYNTAVEMFERLRTESYGEGRPGALRFTVAEGLQNAGLLTLGMSLAAMNAAIDAALATTYAYHEARAA